jgi:hypothetical protein
MLKFIPNALCFLGFKKKGNELFFVTLLKTYYHAIKKYRTRAEQSDSN